MKIKLFLLTCITLLIAMPVQAKLIALYDFEEPGAVDVVGNVETGEVFGNPSHIQINHPVLGITNYAYELDGNDYFKIPLDINPKNYPQLTMGAWICLEKKKNLVTEQVISHDNGGYDRSLCFDFRADDYDEPGWSAFAGDGKVLGDIMQSEGKWDFVAVSYNQEEKTVLLFANGKCLKKENVVLGEGNDFTLIGANPINNVMEYFSGIIDDVFFYDKALDESEITYIMNNGVSYRANPFAIKLPVKPSSDKRKEKLDKIKYNLYQKGKQ